MLNILTIDIEDYYHVSAFESVVQRDDWGKFESRVVDNTMRILSILKAFNTKATFFVLGWVAEQYPQIVKYIEQDGHEVASHSYDHRLIYDQSKEEFREDIRKTKAILESIISNEVLGYRATSYSITEKSLWALDILVEEGFLYDSSIFPIIHDIYGIPNAKRFPHIILDKEKNRLWEFPLSTIRLLGANVPIAGGGYFRLFPYGFTRWAIRRLNKVGHPAIVYIHPWEIDPHQPRLSGSRISRFRHYTNLDKTETRLESLLQEFNFVPIRSFLNLWK